MTRAERIKNQLETHFQPTQLEVIDESDAHHGRQDGVKVVGHILL